ncbi:TPA: hypothetical protein ACLASJ_001569 [Neisseria meningitidis]
MAETQKPDSSFAGMTGFQASVFVGMMGFLPKQKSKQTNKNRLKPRRFH